MNILVTGGAGFIGSNLSKYFYNKGYKIFVIDNLSTGYINNLKDILHNIKLYKEDIADFDFDRLPQIDFVFHLAAQASVPLSVDNYKKSSTENLTIMTNVFDYCIKNKIAFVYASSSAVYGNLEIGDDKSLNNHDLLSPYACDKYVMELYARMIFKIYHIPNIGFRFFNIYGENQDPTSQYSGVISIFLDRILKGKEINIYGGNQTRDFVHISDLLNILDYSMNYLFHNTDCNIYNLLTGNEVSINQLASNIYGICEMEPNLKYLPLLKGDPLKSSGKSEKLLSFLKNKKYEFVPLKNGLENLIKYYGSL
jgi:UDP-glucose 4-epimerase